MYEELSFSHVKFYYYLSACFENLPRKPQNFGDNWPLASNCAVGSKDGELAVFVLSIFLPVVTLNNLSLKENIIFITFCIHNCCGASEAERHLIIILSFQALIFDHTIRSLFFEFYFHNICKDNYFMNVANRSVTCILHLPWGKKNPKFLANIKC